MASLAANVAVTEPTATGGFYTGNGCLRSDEDYRGEGTGGGVTQVGGRSDRHDGDQGRAAQHGGGDVPASDLARDDAQDAARGAVPAGTDQLDSDVPAKIWGGEAPGPEPVVEESVRHVHSEFKGGTLDWYEDLQGHLMEDSGAAKPENQVGDQLPAGRTGNRIADLDDVQRSHTEGLLDVLCEEGDHLPDSAQSIIQEYSYSQPAACSLQPAACSLKSGDGLYPWGLEPQCVRGWT